MSNIAEIELKYIKEEHKKRRSIYTMDLKFHGGENIGRACEVMFNLHNESASIVRTVFNDVLITMERAKQ